MDIRSASLSPARSGPRVRRGRNGFTLVEMMAAMAVLMILLVIIAMATTGARSTMTRATATVGAFATARTAFENLTDKLSQATLNTYFDYYGEPNMTATTPPYVSRAVFTNAHGSQQVFSPKLFGRCSDLQFRIMQNSEKTYYGQEIYFQTPAAFDTSSVYQSTQGLMNSCSYFVQYCSDQNYQPNAKGADGNNILQAASSGRWRYRLMQGLEPSQNMSVYTNTSATSINNGTLGQQASPTAYLTWQTNIENTGTAGPAASTGAGSNVIPVADNVICVVFWPRLPPKNDTVGTALLGSYGNTAQYLYDSQVNIENMFSGGATQQNVWDEQLPPIVQVTMIVIDEASAARIATNTATPPAAIENALKANPSGSPYTTAANLGTDLFQTEASLNKSHVNYRVLSTYVIMREAKWSTSANHL